MSLRPLCNALLILNVTYCCVALAVDALPGWKMFESAERIDYQLTDRNGAPIDVRSYLPLHTYLKEQAQLIMVVRFICQQHSERGPFRFRAAPEREPVTLSAPECQVDAAH